MFKGSVVITGCDSGLGLALCRILPTHGFFVVATCTSREGIRKALEVLSDENGSDSDELTASGFCCKRCGNGACYLLDVTSSMDVETFHKDVLHSVRANTYPALYALINNAGIWRFSLLEESFKSAEKRNMEVDMWREVMETNLLGSLRMTLTFVNNLEPNSDGCMPRIIYLSSVLDRHALPGQGAYVASKFATSGLYETMCHELVDKDVKPIIVRPGALRNTKLFHRDLKIDDPDYVEQLHKDDDLIRASYRLLLNVAGDCNSVATTITEILLDRNPRGEYSDVAGSLSFVLADYIPRSIFVRFVRFALYAIGRMYQVTMYIFNTFR
ncbi:NAD(P)-binding rossmann-fold domains containing protein [Babesia gibsoni]|uniref:NAD(P)-binding rossmann-fold domains containing protein n=1 Tax=Babesia gibsoni TaxID=33632 RepID=A0AAD8LKQ9_BABGI|nr:NAD(P)-binding rossmann-fold domains containing protein [Babesia gibsoni]